MVLNRKPMRIIISFLAVIKSLIYTVIFFIAEVYFYLLGLNEPFIYKMI